MCAYSSICTRSLAGQTLIIGAKESGKTCAKVMFHWNAWRNFTHITGMKRWRLQSVQSLCCSCSTSITQSVIETCDTTIKTINGKIYIYETRNWRSQNRIQHNYNFFCTVIQIHHFLLRNAIQIFFFTGFLSILNSLASLLPLRSQVHISLPCFYFNNWRLIAL